MRLLLVEDNPRLSEPMRTGLVRGGFALDTVERLEDALLAVQTTRYDAAILDLGLPDGDGIDFVRHLRRQRDATPVLILTARDGLSDRVEGLDAGADDYLVKPFAMEELQARLRALLRRPGGSLGVLLEQGNVSLDTVAREVRVGGTPLVLPRRETMVLEQLLRRAGRVVPKSVIEDGIYGFEETVSSNSVEVAMHRLRKLLDGAGANVSVHTVRGVGYLMSAG